MTRCLTLRTALRAAACALLVPSLLSLGSGHTWAKEPDKDKAAIHAKQTKKKMQINKAKKLHQIKAVRSAKVANPAAQLAKLDRKLDILIAEVRKLQREINRRPESSSRHHHGAQSAHPNIHRKPGRNMMHGLGMGHGQMRPSGPSQFGPPPFVHGGPPWMSMKGPHRTPWMQGPKSDRPDQARRGPGGPRGHGPMSDRQKMLGPDGPKGDRSDQARRGPDGPRGHGPMSDRQKMFGPDGPKGDRPDQARRGPDGPRGHGPMFGMGPRFGPQGPMRAGRGMQRGPNQDRPKRPEAEKRERGEGDGPPRGDRPNRPGRGPKRDRGAEKDSDRDAQDPVQ